MRTVARQSQAFRARLTVVLVLVGCALQYMTVSADTWDIQTVDFEGDVGKHTSLALDGLGFPHISYHDVTNYDLKYAYRDAAGWHVQTVDSEGVVGVYTSLALDAEGFPHIGYQDSTDDWPNWELKYAYRDSDGWHVGEIRTGGLGASLVLDPSGFPHISHSWWYSYQDASGWNHENIPDMSVPELGTSLALDAAGGPHITFVAQDSDWLMRYASKPQGSWQTELVDNFPTAGAGSSLILDAYHVLHVSYVTVGSVPWNVKYAWKNESGWHSHLVDQIDYGWDRWWTSLALDSEGFPHFSYWREGNLVIQHWDGAWWYLETVDSDGDVGRFSSMALDASDRPHISYYDDTAGNLKYARLLPSEIALTAELEDGTLLLTWSSVDGVEEYWVFGTAEVPWFPPDLSPPTYVNRVAVVPAGTTMWSSTNGFADPDQNWTYLVIAMENTNIELVRSNRAGEHDFDCEIP
jgi:hypothetical protein